MGTGLEWTEEQFTPDLKGWNEIREDYFGHGIVIGNGQSIAVDPRFEGQSLFAIAKTKLSDDDLRIFENLETENFEEVLGKLVTARKILTAIKDLRYRKPPLASKYDRIKNALIDAVREVHIHRSKLSDDAAYMIGEELSRYKIVFSTNYDLIIYWSLMHWAHESKRLDDIRDHFKDASMYSDARIFWLSGVEDVEKDPRITEFFFLHGALHLFQLPTGEPAKLVYNGQTILNRFYHYPEDGSVPLVVSEGNAQYKLRAINRSTYLAYAFSRLERYCGPLVIFGHRCDKVDEHIVKAINRFPQRRIAISIRAKNDDYICERKAHYRKCFRYAKIDFFQADTHPLGSPDLRMT